MEAMSCPVCGTDSVETVLREEGDGERVLHPCCRECARRQESEEEYRQRRMAASLVTPVSYVGLLLVLLALVADYLAISGRPGFGWRQMIGAEVGLLCVFLGLMLRRAFLGTAGLYLLVLSLLADLLKVGHVPGAGWRAQAALGVGTAMLAAGLYLRRMLTRPPRVPYRDLPAAGQGEPPAHPKSD
jgi:hypothetical protein